MMEGTLKAQRGRLPWGGVAGAAVDYRSARALRVTRGLAGGFMWLARRWYSGWVMYCSTIDRTTVYVAVSGEGLPGRGDDADGPWCDPVQTVRVPGGDAPVGEGPAGVLFGGNAPTDGGGDSEGKPVAAAGALRWT